MQGFCFPPPQTADKTDVRVIVKDKNGPVVGVRLFRK
jgi:hypothetical protein